VVDERRVRGTVERTYALDLPNARPGVEEVSLLTKDDHRRLFRLFVASLLGDFDRYLDSGDGDLVTDDAGYQENVFWLSDAEYRDLLLELTKVFSAFAGKKPSAERKRRLIAAVMVPLEGDR
jgi:hypothetical protein